MKLTRHRIVTDNYAGYECQIWRVYWPFWVQMGFTNTRLSIGEARAYICNSKPKSVVVEKFDPKDC